MTSMAHNYRPQLLDVTLSHSHVPGVLLYIHISRIFNYAGNSSSIGTRGVPGRQVGLCTTWRSQITCLCFDIRSYSPIEPCS